jgi:hypothetical protein
VRPVELDVTVKTVPPAVKEPLVPKVMQDPPVIMVPQVRREKLLDLQRSRDPRD